jgi:hypothetical protein
MMDIYLCIARGDRIHEPKPLKQVRVILICMRQRCCTSYRVFHSVPALVVVSISGVFGLPEDPTECCVW